MKGGLKIAKNVKINQILQCQNKRFENNEWLFGLKAIKNILPPNLSIHYLKEKSPKQLSLGCHYLNNSFFLSCKGHQIPTQWNPFSPYHCPKPWLGMQNWKWQTKTRVDGVTEQQPTLELSKKQPVILKSELSRSRSREKTYLL